MVNVNKLKAKMVEMETNATELSDKININKATFYRKMKDGGEQFTVGEVDAMAKELHLTRDELNAIFFAQFVA